MKKILCLVDYSPASVAAAQLAAFIAHQASGLLTLLHVVHLPIADTSQTALMAGDLLAEQKRDAEEKLKGICDRIQRQLPGGEASLNTNCLVQEALLTDAVGQMTSEEGYSLVVMGKTGSGNSLEELLVGSNTQAVIQQVKCPVLAFPEEAPRNPIRKIIYASDYQDQDLAGLREAGEVAALLGAQVEVVHVSGKEKHALSPEAADFVQRLQQAFPGEIIAFEEFYAEEEEAGLLKYLQNRNGDLLAVLKKEGGFFTNLFRQSLTDRLAYHTRLPLLVVHGLERPPLN
jgi:nucleotide-binding universal stress UspA family protein